MGKAHLHRQLLQLHVANVARHLNASHFLVWNTMRVRREVQPVQRQQIAVVGDQHLDCEALAALQRKRQRRRHLFLAPFAVDFRVAYNVVLR